MIAVTVMAVLGGLLAIVPLPVLTRELATMTTETRRPRFTETSAATSTTTTPPSSSAATAAPAAADAHDPGDTADHPGDDHTDDPDDVAAAATAPGRQVATETDLEPFVLIGITAEDRTGDDVYARVRTDGTWGEWFPLSMSDDHGPDPGSAEQVQADASTAEGDTSGSEPTWVGDADAYELSVPEDQAGVDVHLVREGEERVRVDLHEDPADGAPTIRSRASWGARPARPGVTASTVLEMAVVHHTVDSNSYTSSQVPAMLRAIQAFHQDARGWYDIAYNFVVDRFGRIWEARGGGIDRVVDGGHTRGFNLRTVGVALLGDFTSSAPPSATLTATAELIAWKFAHHGVEPTGSTLYTTATGSPTHPPGTHLLPRIIGHRNVGTTGCPGLQTYLRLSTIRQRVVARYPTLQRTYSPIARRYQATGGATGPLGARTADDRAIRGPYANGGRVGQFAQGTIYWSPTTGARAVWGRIRSTYAGLGSSGGPLHLPVSDIRATPDGRTKYTIFQGGRIYSFQTGRLYAVAILGSFETEHRRAGGVFGPLGYPIADEREISLPTGGQVQFFDRGRAVRVAGQTFSTSGPIDVYHRSHGGMGGAYGYPVAHETGAEDGLGRTQQFEGGRVWVPPTADLPVQGVSGAILEQYLAAGGPAGALGYPTGEPDPTTVPGRIVQQFQHGTIAVPV